MVYLGQNVSIEDMKFTGIPESVESVLKDLEDTMVELQEGLETERRSNEHLHEQVSFARDLVESLEYSLNNVTSAKQAREAFVRCLENGYFER